MEEKRKMICFVLWLQLQKGETIERCICYILHPMVLYVGYANCKITKDHYELNGIRFAKKNQTHKNFQFNGNKVKRYDVNRLSHGRKFPYTIMEIPSTDELNAGCLIEQNFFPFFSNLGVTVFPDKLLRDEGVEK